MVDETQTFLTPEATSHHKSMKLLTLIPLRADLLYILHYETPCRYFSVCVFLEVSYLEYNFLLDILLSKKPVNICMNNIFVMVFFQEYTGSSQYKSNGDSKHRNGGTKSNLNTASREGGGGLSRTVNNAEPSYRTELR